MVVSSRWGPSLPWVSRETQSTCPAWLATWIGVWCSPSFRFTSPPFSTSSLQMRAWPLEGDRTGGREGPVGGHVEGGVAHAALHLGRQVEAQQVLGRVEGADSE